MQELEALQSLEVDHKINYIQTSNNIRSKFVNEEAQTNQILSSNTNSRHMRPTRVPTTKQIATGNDSKVELNYPLIV